MGGGGGGGAPPPGGGGDGVTVTGRWVRAGTIRRFRAVGGPGRLAHCTLPQPLLRLPLPPPCLPACLPCAELWVTSKLENCDHAPERVEEACR